MSVAESVRDDIRGPYRLKARLLTDPKDAEYAIDMTTLRTPDGRLYALWCGRPSPYGQGLYVSRMANPWTLTGPRAHLDASGFGSPVVREGPAILQRKGKIYLIYSASPTDLPDYKLGLLVADARADLADPKSWVQRPDPVFTRRDEVEMYGPGHNSFFKSPDGREDWIAYHAKAGTATSYADRFTHVQPFTWGRNGDPVFGRPLDPKIPVRVPSGER